METKDLKELRSLRAEQVEVAEKAIEDEKPEEAKDAMAQIKELDARIEKVEQDVKKLKDEENENEDEDKDKTNEEPKAQGQGEQRNMTNEFKPSVTEERDNKELRSFMEYIKSKGAVRDGVKLVDAEPVIPKDISTQPVELPETVTDLKDFTNVVQVKSGSGSYPVLESATEVMHSVAELEQNPELAKPKFKKVAYEVETYRGSVAVSEESLQDSDQDLGKIIADNNARIGLNTTNKAIADVMKTFPAKEVDGTDGIKTILNVDLDPAYNVTIVASQTFFNVLDTLKDKNGQYILQADINSPSGKSISGRPVRVIADNLLGAKGEAKAFIGDIKHAILFADRQQSSARWINNDIYGQLLGIAQRFDVVKAVEEAGYFVSYKAPAEDDNAGA